MNHHHQHYQWPLGRVQHHYQCPVGGVKKRRKNDQSVKIKVKIKVKENPKKDNLYNKEIPKDHKFTFNSEVTDVFEDMVHRSVPGYEFLIENIGFIAKKFYQRNTNIYDLGSSLCACSLSVQDKIQNINSTKGCWSEHLIKFLPK